MRVVWCGDSVRVVWCEWRCSADNLHEEEPPRRTRHPGSGPLGVAAVFDGEEKIDDHVHDPDDDSSQERRPESVHVEAHREDTGDPGSQSEHRSIDDHEEETEGQDVERYREDHDDGADQHVDEGQNDAGQDVVQPDVVAASSDTDAGDDLDAQPQSKGVDEGADKELHAYSLVSEAEF